MIKSNCNNPFSLFVPHSRRYKQGAYIRVLPWVIIRVLRCLIWLLYRRVCLSFFYLLLRAFWGILAMFLSFFSDTLSNNLFVVIANIRNHVCHNLLRWKQFWVWIVLSWECTVWIYSLHYLMHHRINWLFNNDGENLFPNQLVPSISLLWVVKVPYYLSLIFLMSSWISRSLWKCWSRLPLTFSVRTEYRSVICINRSRFDWFWVSFWSSFFMK